MGRRVTRRRAAAIIARVDEVLDVRGLRCPLPVIRARRRLPDLAPGAALVVLATDPEAPIDLAALAADHGLAFAQHREGDGWRLVLGPGRVV
jgi:tRNA 2-thiouridine synthesizing protein A